MRSPEERENQELTGAVRITDEFGEKRRESEYQRKWKIPFESKVEMSPIVPSSIWHSSTSVRSGIA
jgi:hypothetical protein